MPKIIENLPQRLADEARRQIEESGFSAMTVRSVAKACGVGVGTVYNYFLSKDDLLARYMLADWYRCVEAVQAASKISCHADPVARCIYDQLRQFAARHQNILQDKEAIAGFSASFSRYHKILRRQLAQPLEKFCSSAFAAEFIAESLLTWTLTGTSFDEIFGMIEKLF